MTRFVAHSRTLALTLSLAVLSPVALLHAQTTPKAATGSGGTTGTDPCPKGYICTNGSATPSGPQNTTTASAPAATPSSSSPVVQALLRLLGKG